MVRLDPTNALLSKHDFAIQHVLLVQIGEVLELFEVETEFARLRLDTAAERCTQVVASFAITSTLRAIHL